MRTYQDLQAVGQDENARMEFIKSAIMDHKGSAPYKIAVDAQMYYDGENPTINRYEKILYDMQGKAHRDMYTANHKIASRFFGLAVDQEVNYLLSNGISFSDDKTKSKLGTLNYDFDEQTMVAAENALIGGEAFGFWNLDHVEVFSLTEFVPLYDEETSGLKAGIRFWQIDSDRPLRATLYELDGYTDYIEYKGKDMEVLTEKRKYKQIVRQSEVDGMEILDGENYAGFPIVPLKNNKRCKSELNGKRNTIDALDLATSNMVNNVDEGNLIYWVLTNCGGMDDLDDAKFVDRLKTTHVAHADGDDGATVTANTIEAPFQGTQTTITELKERLYEDFQCFNASAVTAANQSATAINAAYTNLDLKVDKFERQVSKFVRGILLLAGIDDKPAYTRNRIINRLEEVQAILMVAQHVDDEYILRKVLTLFGDIDLLDEMLKRKAAEDLERLTGGNEPQEEEQEENEDGDIND